MEQAQEIWDRQANETSRAYRAFETYVSMGADRSVVKVARKLAVSRALISRWSAQFDWVSRTREYDDHVSKLSLERVASMRAGLAEKQVTLAVELFEMIARGLRGLKRRGKKLTAVEIARLYYVASRGIRDAFGDQPTANAPPKIVVLALRRNRPRDWQAEAMAAAERLQ